MGRLLQFHSFSILVLNKGQVSPSAAVTPAQPAQGSAIPARSQRKLADKDTLKQNLFPSSTTSLGSVHSPFLLGTRAGRRKRWSQHLAEERGHICWKWQESLGVTGFGFSTMETSSNFQRLGVDNSWQSGTTPLSLTGHPKPDGTPNSLSLWKILTLGYAEGKKRKACGYACTGTSTRVPACTQSWEGAGLLAALWRWVKRKENSSSWPVWVIRIV